MSQQKDDIQEIGQTWNKIEKNIKRVGLGEGLSNGKDSNFQNYFDLGFSEGFRNAYQIGYYKGAVLYVFGSHYNLKRVYFRVKNEQEQTNLPEDQLLAQPELGWCYICKNPEATNSSIADVKAQQSDICNKNLEHFKKTEISMK